jgi:hypothetical protein
MTKARISSGPFYFRRGMEKCIGLPEQKMHL